MRTRIWMPALITAAGCLILGLGRTGRRSDNVKPIRTCSSSAAAAMTTPCRRTLLPREFRQGQCRMVDRLRPRHGTHSFEPCLRKARLGQGVRRHRARRMLLRRHGSESARPHPRTSPPGNSGRCPALQHAQLPQRGLAQPQYPGLSSPACTVPAMVPGAHRRRLYRQGQSHHQGLSEFDHEKRGTLQQLHRQASRQHHPLAHGKQTGKDGKNASRDFVGSGQEQLQGKDQGLLHNAGT